MELENPTEGPTVALGRKRVGGYILGDTIGEGSFAKVRVGTHVMTQERVAIKIIDKRLIANRDYVRKNLRREAAMLRKLNHANITKLYEVLETQNNYYLVMELAEGGEFMRYLCDRRKLSERETRKFMRQLVSSVEYMHQAELIHRDIKIENFLLDASNNLKVIDFGLSNVLGPDGFLRTQCGSPAYAAPEIFCSTSYGPAVDVWSIGINMYAMLTGELPFNVDPPTNMFKLHAKIIEGCTLPQYLTKDCKDLMSRLLKVDETSRIKLGDVMTHPWMNRGYSERLKPCLYPNKLTADNLNMDLINYMVGLDFTAKEVIENVIENRPVPDHAMYHLLVRRLQKGWGYPDELTQHVQYADDGESDVTTITPRSTQLIAKDSTDKSSVRKDNCLDKTVVEDKNEINRSHDDTLIGVKRKQIKLTRFQNGRTFEDKMKPKAKDILEEVTNSLKGIDLNNNNNDNKMINKNVKVEKPRSLIKAWKSRRERRDDSRCTYGVSQIHSDFQERLTDLDTFSVEPVRLSEISETETESHKKEQRPCTESCRQQTFRPRRQLQRSMSHTSNVGLASHQNADHNCFIIVNGKLAQDSKPVGVPTRYRRAKTVTTEGPSTWARPKERLRRSNTDPSIYNSFAQRHVYEPSGQSDFHRNEFPAHKLGSFSHNQKPSNSMTAGAKFGFPTRLRSSGRSLARLGKSVSKLKPGSGQKVPNDIAGEDSVSLPSIQ